MATLADILASLTQNLPQGYGVRGLMHPVGDVIDARNRFGYVPEAEQGMALARPILPQMGVLSGGASNPEQFEVYTHNFGKILGPFDRETAVRVSKTLKDAGAMSHAYLSVKPPLSEAEKYNRAMSYQRVMDAVSKGKIPPDPGQRRDD